MDALALTDTNGLYGAVRFWNAATEAGIKPIWGVELQTLDFGHLVLIARDEIGWRSLCRTVSAAQLAGEKTKPRATLALVRENADGLFALTGCAHGMVPRAMRAGDVDAARESLATLASIFGGRRSRALRHPRRARERAGSGRRGDEQRPLRLAGGAAPA